MLIFRLTHVACAAAYASIAKPARQALRPHHPPQGMTPAARRAIRSPALPSCDPYGMHARRGSNAHPFLWIQTRLQGRQPAIAGAVDAVPAERAARTTCVAIPPTVAAGAKACAGMSAAIRASRRRDVRQRMGRRASHEHEDISSPIPPLHRLDAWPLAPAGPPAAVARAPRAGRATVELLPLKQSGGGATRWRCVTSSADLLPSDVNFVQIGHVQQDQRHPRHAIQEHEAA